MDAQALETMIEIVLKEVPETSSESDRHNRQRVQTFIIRGFYNTLDILKKEFLDTLEQFDLQGKFFNFFVQSMDQSILKCEDMVSANLLESRTDTVRTHVMSNYDLCLQSQNIDRKICILAGGKDSIQSVYSYEQDGQKEEDFWAYRVLRKFGEEAEEAVKGAQKVIRPGNGKEQKQYEFGLLSVEQLMLLDRQILSQLSKVNRVITQDKIDFQLFLTVLKDKVLSDPLKWEDCLDIGAFYTLSGEDFEALSLKLDSTVPYAKSSDFNNVGYMMREVVKVAELADEKELVEHLYQKFYPGCETLNQVAEQMQKEAMAFIETKWTDDAEKKEEMQTLVVTSFSKFTAPLTEEKKEVAAEESKEESKAPPPL